MKKLFLAIAMVMGACQLSFAQTEQSIQEATQQSQVSQEAPEVPEIMRQFKNQPGAQYMFQMPRMSDYEKVFQETKTDSATQQRTLEGVKKIKGIHMLMCNKCSEEVQARFGSALTRLEDYGYHTMMEVKRDSIKTNVLVKSKDNIIEELGFLFPGMPNTDNAPMLVIMQVRMTNEEMQEMQKNGMLLP